MATQFQQQAEAQLNPLFNQQQQAIQSQIPSIQNLYDTLTKGLQGQYQQNLASGVQGIVEDASARGVLRSTLPVDARQSLTGQLGAALQQSLGELGARRAGDIAGVNTSLAQLGLQRASSIADLSRALETQDLERQRLAMDKQNAERQFQLEQQKLAAARQSAASQAAPKLSIDQEILNAFASDPGTPMYTERVIIPAIRSMFGLTQAQAAAKVYPIRKSLGLG